MRELTKKQKIKVLDLMIETVNEYNGLCQTYNYAMRKLNYNQYGNDSWTPRFKELSNKIASEITRTCGCTFIDYGMNKEGTLFDDKKWKSGRLKLLKDLKKKMESK